MSLNNQMPDSSKQARFNRMLTPVVYRRAWNFACRLCTTREDAEDLLQDALANAFRGLDNLRDPERFGPWLMTIVHNRFRRLYRRRQPADADTYWHQLVRDGAVGDPLAESIAEALTRLPDAQRLVLSLFYLDGLTLEETGEVLGAGPQVVGQRLYRARRALRRLLKESRVTGIQQPQRCKQ